MPRRFPLAAIASLRRQSEAAAERALARADAELRTAAVALHAVEQTLQQHSAMRLSEVGQQFSAAHYQAISSEWSALKAQQAAQQRVLVQHATLRQQAQEQFLAARQQRETVEVLESDWQMARRQQDEKKEQSRLDDLSGTRLQQEKQGKDCRLH